MEDKIVYEEKDCVVHCNLNFTTPKNFIQIYFDTETLMAQTVEISASCIKVDWKDPKIYMIPNEQCIAEFINNLDFDPPVPSCIWSSSDESTASSTCSNIDYIGEDAWETAVQERDKLHRECYAMVCVPFRCINDFEFFSTSVSCLDVDDNPTLPLFEYDAAMNKCWSFRKSLWCIFPSYYYYSKRPVLSESASDADDWKRSFYTYKELDKKKLL